MAKQQTKATELNAIFKEKGTSIETLQEAKAIYNKIAEECYQSGKWTQFNLALAFINKEFFKLCEQLKKDEVLDNYIRFVFVNDNSYTASLSKSNDETGELDNLLSVTFKNDSKVEKLVDTYDFRIQN